MARDPRTCDQTVYAEDDCCRTERCAVVAAWLHRPSGLALCEQHEANARRYSANGEWDLGGTRLSYPEGWEPLGGPVATPAAAGSEPAPPASSVLWKPGDD